METKRNVLSLDQPRAGGLVYSVAACMPYVASVVFLVVLQILYASGAIGDDAAGEDWYILLSYLLPQLCLFGALVFFKTYTRTPLKEIYAPPKARYFLLAVLLQFGLFSLSSVNSYFIAFLQKIGFPVSEDVMSLPSLDGAGFFLAVLVIAVLPAIFEESIFRSLMLRSMKGLGTVWCVVACGALFALFHGKPVQTVYQFFCGCAFALVAIRAGSVLPTMLSHFLNNFFILVLYKAGMEESFATPAFYVVSGVCLIGSVLWLILDKSGNQKGAAGKKEFFLTAWVGILVCGVAYIAGLFV